MERILSVGLGVTGDGGPGNGSQGLRDEALEYHFPKTRHRLSLLPTGPTASANHRVQDYFKFGQVSGQGKVLVTRRLFEGDPDSGIRHQPLRQSWSNPRFVGSKLS